MWDKRWDKIFETHDWGQYPPEELIRFMGRTFGKQTDRSAIAVLEVGCGTGANIWFLAREGYRTIGIDGSPNAIAKAQARLQKENLHAELTTGDIMKLPFAAGEFDCVIDIECIYANSMADSKVIMREIHRVLKPGGCFFSKTFMTGTYEGALRNDYGLIRFSSEDDIKDLYSAFEIKNIDYIVRSEKNRAHEVKEWLITARKAKV